MNLGRTEFEVVGEIRQLLSSAHPAVLQGPGDDCAVLQAPTGRLLASSDMLVEGVHFRLDWMSPYQLGRKALAVNLSDVAAMAGKPLYALVSLALRPGLDPAFINGFYRGLREMAAAFGLAVVGGDTVRAERVVVDIAILGEAGRPVLRSGAQPGDLLAVTGCLGEAAAGLAWLQTGRDLAGKDLSPNQQEAVARVVASHLEPWPRVKEAAALAASDKLTALMDLSDGLAGDLRHLAQESGVGSRLVVPALPVGEATRVVARMLQEDALQWALSGGEDYELLLTLSPQDLAEARCSLEPGVRLSIIGEIRPQEEGLTVVDQAGVVHPLEARGYEHCLAEDRGSPLRGKESVRGREPL